MLLSGLPSLILRSSIEPRTPSLAMALPTQWAGLIPISHYLRKCPTSGSYGDILLIDVPPLSDNSSLCQADIKLARTVQETARARRNLRRHENPMSKCDFEGKKKWNSRGNQGNWNKPWMDMIW